MEFFYTNLNEIANTLSIIFISFFAIIFYKVAVDDDKVKYLKEENKVLKTKLQKSKQYHQEQNSKIAFLENQLGIDSIKTRAVKSTKIKD
jgi:uncharacterized membrane protein (DUF106 family)